MTRLVLFCILMFLAQKSNAQELDTIAIRTEAQAKVDLAKETGTKSLGIVKETALLHEAAVMFLAIKDWPNHIYAMCVLASYSYQQGHFVKWNSYLDSIDKIAPIYLSEYERINLTFKSLKSGQLIQNGEVSQAIILLENVLSKPEHLENVYLKISFIERLAHAYELAGDYDKAKRTIIPGIAINPHPLNKGRALAKLARIYSKEKDYENCLITISKSLEQLSAANTNEIFRLELLRRYIDKAEYLLEVDQIDSCLYYIDHTLNHEVDIPDDVRAKCYMVQANALHQKGELINALDLAQKGYQALKLAHPNESQLNLKTAEGALVLNKIYVDLDKLEKSESLLIDALGEVGIDDVSNLKDHIHTHNYSTVVQLLSALSKTKIQLYHETNEQSNLTSALEIQKDIFNVLAHLRKNNLDSSYLGFWAKENQKLYEEAIQICVLAEEHELALAFMEENKSNLLAKNMNEQVARGKMYISAQLLEAENTYIRSLHILRLELEELLKNPDTKDEALVSIGDQINDAQIKLNDVQKEIKIQNPEYYNLIYNDQLLQLKKLQKEISPESAIIEYFLGDNYSCVVSITRNTFQFYPIDGAEDLKDLHTLSAKLIDTKSTITDIDSALRELSTIILKDIIADLPNPISDLIIIPDGQLNNFPFELLFDPNGEQLLEHFNIHYQYSARMYKMLYNRSTPDYSYDLTTYGYGADGPSFTMLRDCADVEQSSLVCVDKELASIQSELKDKVVKSDLWKSSEIFKAAGESRILHLATHSCLDEDDVNQSKIFFDDQSVTLYEIQNLNLDSELTVLSSCESGFGKLVKGEGGMSISKAFIQSGSNSTLVSLWPVDDCTTSDLMSFFYANLNAGMKKNEALRVAKLYYLESAHPSRLHPYYWAGFVLVGNEQPVWRNPTSLLSYSIPVLILFLMLILVVILLKRK